MFVVELLCVCVSVCVKKLQIKGRYIRIYSFVAFVLYVFRDLLFLVNFYGCVKGMMSNRIYLYSVL